MNKKIFSIIGIVVVIVVAVGAFVTTQHSKKSSTDPTSTASENKTLRFSDIALSSHPTVWYYGVNSQSSDKNLTRETAIQSVYVLKDGTVTTYGITTTLDKINKMSDKQVIALAKQKDKKDFEDSLTDDLKRFNSDEDIQQTMTAEEISKGVQTLKALKYEAPKPIKINITASNNGQNKKPLKEEFKTTWNYVQSEGGEFAMRDFTTTRDGSILLSSQSQFNNEVDGTKYNGYDIDFFTKVKSDKTIFALDDEKSKLIKHEEQSDATAD